MSLTVKTLIGATALALLAAITLLVAQDDAAAAGKRAGTTITLNTFPKPFGAVKSSRPKACADGRRIAIFEQRGAHQRPRSDKRVATTTSYRYHGAYQWKANPGRVGKLYAIASQTPRCKGAHSKTVGTPAPRGGNATGCPSPASYAHDCVLPDIHFDDSYYYCASFTSAHGDCDGKTDIKRYSASDDLHWQTCCTYANFHWSGQEDGPRYAALWVYDDRGGHATKAYLEGTVPGPGSNRFSVIHAWTDEVPDKWCTQDRAGSSAGDPGGPLKLKFDSGSLGADVYISGFLVKPGYGCG